LLVADHDQSGARNGKAVIILQRQQGKQGGAGIARKDHAPVVKRQADAFEQPRQLGHEVIVWKERERAMTAAQNATAEAAGLLPWRDNSLRHSFCASRVAATQDVARTALEAGNLAAAIFSHYRALATEAEGQAWFETMPPRAAPNAVRLPSATKV